MPGDKSGYTLLEIMISISISATLMAGLLILVRHVQFTTFNLHCLLEREQNLRLVPLILSRLAPSGGNQHWRNGWAGITLDGGELGIRADLDGGNGFPDGEAASSYEDIRLRSRDRHLQIRSGSGTFQPFLRNIARFEVVQPSPELLQLTITAETDPLLLWKPARTQRQTEILFWLRNFQVNLFGEEP